jgi:hypothetical protein
MQQLSHYGQSKTSASGVSIPGIVKAGESLKYALAFSSRYAGSVIEHGQYRPAAFGAQYEVDVRAGMAHCVVDQVGHHPT